jgi:hypothetical protein
MKLARIILVSAIVFAAALASHAQTHEIDVTAVNVATATAGCTAANPCTMQLYRLAAACPVNIDLSTFTLLSGTVGGTPSATGETWFYPDTGALAAGQTYCYAATATDAEGRVYPVGQTFQGSIPAPLPQVNVTGKVIR